jgi:hypothetical protein
MIAVADHVMDTRTATRIDETDHNTDRHARIESIDRSIARARRERDARRRRCRGATTTRANDARAIGSGDGTNARANEAREGREEARGNASTRTRIGGARSVIIRIFRGGRAVSDAGLGNRRN